MHYECDTLIEIVGFGGYSHYSSTLSQMNKNTDDEFFIKLSETKHEIVFQCTTCKQIWRLAEPDYPVQGYFVRSPNE